MAKYEQAESSRLPDRQSTALVVVALGQETCGMILEFLDGATRASCSRRRWRTEALDLRHR